MKVKIGKYINFFGPYQIAEKILFWLNRWKNDDAARIHDLGEKIAKIPGITKLCESIYRRRKRKISIKIDGYDIWNMDNTLTYIILPMLKKLRDSKAGSPWVDNADVPKDLYLEDPFCSGNNSEEEHKIFHERWAYVLNEMIWAFEVSLTDWEMELYNGKLEFLWTPKNEAGEKIVDANAGYFRKDPRKDPTAKYDFEADKIFWNRIRNGQRLLGVYYGSLWT